MASNTALPKAAAAVLLIGCLLGHPVIAADLDAPPGEAAALPSAAAETTPTDAVAPVGKLRFNGFGTLGAVHASSDDDRVFHRDLSQPSNSAGTRYDVDTRLGLQLNYSASQQLEFVAQLLLKRRVSEAPLGDAVEWAFMSYRPTPEWTLRLGRTNPDAFLLSDYRNVDFAYLWARPETGYYGAVPLYSLDGGDIARDWSSSDGARWKARFFTGRGHGFSTTVAGQPVTRVSLSNLSGVSLSRELDALTLRASVLHMRIQPSSMAGMPLLDQALAQLQALPLPNVSADAAALRSRLPLKPGGLTYVQFGANYEGHDWLLSGEFSTIRGSFVANHGRTGYVSVGRRLGAFTPYAVLAASRADGAPAPWPQWESTLAPIVGPQLAAQAQMLGTAAAAAINSQRLTQRSFTLGTRWDFDPRMALKLQWDRYRVDANGTILWSNATPRTETVNVGSVVFDFVF